MLDACQTSRAARRSALRWALAAAAAVVAALPARAGKADDTLVAAFPREIVTTDGLYSTNRENDILGLLVDDALFYVESKTLAVVGLLARSHRFVGDRLLEVELHAGVRFHDGSELSADDVAYSYQWILDDKSDTSYTKRTQRWLERVEPVGRHLVRFHMKRPYPMALYDLAYYTKVRRKGSYHPGGAPTPTAMSAQINGTGPYRVVEFVAGQRVVLERFDGYRRGSPKGTPPIRRIVIRSIPDPGTVAAEAMAGGVQWAYGLPTDVADDVGRSQRAQFVAGEDMRVGYLVMDAAGRAAQGGPLTQLKVRQAINHAIDRQGISRNLMRGTSAVIHSACNPLQFGCAQDVARYEFSPDKARALLREAGFPNGFAIELWASREKTEMEAVASQLKRVGIQAKVSVVKAATLGKARDENKLPLFYTTWGSFSIPHAGAIAPDMFAAGVDNNFSGDAEVSRLIEAATSTNDRAAAEAAFRQAFQRIAAQAYWVPMFTYTNNYLLSNDLQYVPWKDGMQRLFELRWK